ncbi:hypothetical protein FSZ31_04315 [Sphingorhabdus soli]|uniref:SF3 helicase domain-containing protein n=1 Tax=Flavisphingopyxis soli TaxID=2601267 RepID=A0A5C6UP76_9SPHN|nr:phage/plasmid primase, P4 family [Sphingorhabdus soli]TXC73951.1 hypothetical protein FSZ31_04315 [Sphingorhabdus soli]
MIAQSTTLGEARSPEAIAGIWSRLDGLARSIGDGETRAQYLAAWRTRFDAAFPTPDPSMDDVPIVPDGRLAGLTAEERGRVALIGAAWLARVAGFVDGGDNDAVKRFAWGVGQRVAADMVGEEAAIAALLAKLELEELPREIARSFAAGQRKGFDPWQVVVSLRCAAHPMTDLGNAERFRDRYLDDFRFTTAKGWLGWDGRRWRVLDQEQDSTPAEVQAAVFDTIRSIQHEARCIRETGWGDDTDLIYWIEKAKGHGRTEAADLGMNRLVHKGRKVEPFDTILGAWGRSSESAGKLGCIANLAKRWLTVAIEEFDTDPFTVNALNGTLRFERIRDDDGKFRAIVRLREHRREDLNTKLAPVEYDPHAECPLYDAVIEWAQPDAAMRRYLHQWGGYSACGHVGEQQLQFWYGRGANGKSTIIDAWAGTVGDYAGTIGIETFLDQGIKKRGDQATPDLAKLGGVRMLRASEPERGAKLNEALVKAATGGEPMSVRALHKGFFDLNPLFKLTIGGNYRPDVPGTDEGIWRRLKLVPWDQHLPVGERDKDLPGKLKLERAGILNRLVEGLIDWMDHGLTEPDAVKAATAAYRDDSDPLARFLRMCTEMDPDSRVQSSVLYGVFVAWAKAAGEYEWKNKGFSQAMQAKGFIKKASNGIQWMGLKLVRQADDFLDHEGNVRRIEEDEIDAIDAPRAPPDDAPAAPDPRDGGGFDD